MKWIILMQIILMVRDLLGDNPARGMFSGGVILMALVMFWIAADD